MSNKLWILIVGALLFSTITSCNKPRSKNELNVLVELLDIEKEITRNNCAIKCLESEVNNGYDYLKYIERELVTSDENNELRRYMNLNVGMVGTALEEEYYKKEVLFNQKIIICDSFLQYFDSSSVEYAIIYQRICAPPAH